jgi:hypothetical protein
LFINRKEVAVRSLLLSLTMLSLAAVAPAVAQTVQTSPGKVVTGPRTLPSVEPYSQRASNLPGMPIHSEIAPALPSVDLGPNATATDYLEAARSALAADQTGRAQSALENAETLLLTRSVALGATGNPDDNPAVRNVNAALQSLGSNDIQGAMNLVEQTIPMTQQATLGGPPPMGGAPTALPPAAGQPYPPPAGQPYQQPYQQMGGAPPPAGQSYPPPAGQPYQRPYQQPYQPMGGAPAMPPPPAGQPYQQ